MQSRADSEGAQPAFGFALSEGTRVRRQRDVSVPGPTLVLRRGEPVEITLVNRLPEATAIHWHGMELDSYYDGVHGWSGVGPARHAAHRAGRHVRRPLHAAARPARSSITRTCTTTGS